MYKIHSKSAIVLENEPKLADVSKLIDFKPDSTRARVYILGHNQILWENGDVEKRAGVAPGLGGDSDVNDSRTPTPFGEPGDLDPDADRRASALEPTTDPAVAQSAQSDQDMPPIQVDAQFHTSQPSAYEQEAQTSDLFRPFLDPEMLDLFPNGQAMDFSQLRTPSSWNLDFFDAWETHVEAGTTESYLGIP